MRGTVVAFAAVSLDAAEASEACVVALMQGKCTGSVGTRARMYR